jgi:hypothetical protein
MVSVISIFSLALYGVRSSMSDNVHEKVPLMRAEHRNANVALHLGAGGEMIQDAVNPEVAISKAEKASQGEHIMIAGLRKSAKSKNRARTRNRDMCDEDFVLGEMDTDNCKSGPSEEEIDKSHERVLDREECREAAVLANATMPEAYMLDETWYEVHPQGCFVYPCMESRNKSSGDHGQPAGEPTICYYYNPIGEPPSGNITGTPVCSRPFLLNGTKDTMKECPDGYTTIAADTTGYTDYELGLTAETECGKAGRCLSDMEADEFQDDVGIASNHEIFPKGCFIADDGEVFYNKELEGYGEPTGPTFSGTPICIVANVTSFSRPDPPKVTAAYD